MFYPPVEPPAAMREAIERQRKQQRQSMLERTRPRRRDIEVDVQEMPRAVRPAARRFLGALAWIEHAAAMALYAVGIGLAALVVIAAIAWLLHGLQRPAFGATVGDLFRACADVLPERRELFQEAAREAGGHGRADATAQVCRTMVPSAVGFVVTKPPAPHPDSFLDPGSIAGAIKRSYPPGTK